MILLLLIGAIAGLTAYLLWTGFQAFRLIYAERIFLAELVAKHDQNLVRDFLQRLEQTFRANQANSAELEKLLSNLEVVIATLELNSAVSGRMKYIFSALKQPSMDGRAHYLYKLYEDVCKRLPREKFMPQPSEKRTPAQTGSFNQRSPSTWNTNITDRPN